MGKTYLPLRFRQALEPRGQLRPAPFVLDDRRVPSQPNQSVIDATRVLQVLVFHDRPVTGTEVARLLGMNITRAHRLLRTLSLTGMVFQNARKRFVPGPAMQVLATQALFNSDLAEAAREPLNALHVETGLEVAMGILWQDYVSYLYHAAPDMPLEAAPGNVSLYPASQSSLGRMLMSGLPEEQVRQIFRDRVIVGYGDNGLEALLADLRVARERGYARVERPTRTARVTLAIRLAARPFAAIGVGGNLLPEQTEDLVARLLKAADAIGARLDARDTGPGPQGNASI